MDYTLAKRIAAAVRKVFPDAVADSAEDQNGETWKNREALYDPDVDTRVRAAPDFHNWREK